MRHAGTGTCRSSWSQKGYHPMTDKSTYSEEQTETGLNELNDRLFSETSMYSRLRTFAQSSGMEQMFRALPYARSCHEGQTRYPIKGSSVKIPYINHPLMMCCHALAMGLRDDALMAGILLHDVCEDCGVAPEDLPFTEEVKEVVRLVTKDRNYFLKDGKAAREAYYAQIRTSKKAMLIKCLDRCNNISTMALSFSKRKMLAYIRETEEYIIPILNELKDHYLEYNDAAFMMKYQLRGLMETQKALLQGGS